MSDADWDADEFEPEAPVPRTVGTDKWEGEDEDDDLKDNWDDDDEEEEEEDEAKKTATKTETKKKKTVKERILEKEAKRKQELEERKKQEEEAERLRREKMTPEELAAEKLRIQLEQEESDLQLAMDTFGVTNDELAGRSGIDGMLPTTVEEFEKFKDALRNKITKFEKSPFYVGFLDNLIRDLCAGMEADDIKKLGSTLNTLGNEKSKLTKGPKGKKKKGKSLNVGKGQADAGLDDYGDAYGDYDDFI